MAGLHTDSKLAILTVSGGGISIDTFADFDALLRAAAYRFCAGKAGDTAELEALTADVVAAVKRDWTEVVTEDESD